MFTEQNNNLINGAHRPNLQITLHKILSVSNNPLQPWGWANSVRVRSATCVIANVHRLNRRTNTHILVAFLFFVPEFILNTCCLTSSCQATVASSGCSLCWFCLLPCLLSLPVRCRNNFPDRFALPRWRPEKQQHKSNNAVHRRSSNFLYFMSVGNCFQGNIYFLFSFNLRSIPVEC